MADRPGDRQPRRRPECPSATRVARYDAAGELVSVSYFACSRQPHKGDRHEVKDGTGRVVAWWLTGIDFELRPEGVWSGDGMD